MTRALRIEYPGAVYHVICRGNNRQAIFRDDQDRKRYIEKLSAYCQDKKVDLLAYCLMSNHVHVLFETPEGKLSKMMQAFQTSYTLYFNRRHGRTGHVFEQRYKAMLVDKDNYLLELCRYVVLNPVRAKVTQRPGDWKWSSYRGMVDTAKPPEWLAVKKVMSFFSGQRANYQKFVNEGIGKPSVWDELKGQIYLGDESFRQRMQNLVDGKVVRGIAKAQTKPLSPDVNEIVATVGRAYGITTSRVLDRSHVEAYWLAVYLMRRVGNLSLQNVAGRVGVSAARISQIQTKIEQENTSAMMVQVLRRYKLKN